MRAHPLHCLLLAALLAISAGASHARLQEEQFDLPVKVVDAYGKPFAQSIKVTLFFDDANTTPAPVLVLNHGRAAQPADRVKLGRARYPDAAKFFVQRGFIVAVPTRMGYGVSGGEDVEASGPCNRKDYPPGFAAAAAQTLAVLEAVRNRPDAAKDRAVIVGQSYGGATAVATAAQNPPGVVGAINFAGGSGGNPATQPQQPCAPHLLERLYRGYGETARVPMLWLYTENDMYFGPTYPRAWHAAFVAAGGKAGFVQFPPHGDDGHSLFTRFPSVWQPRVAEFLDGLGFRAQPAKAN